MKLIIVVMISLFSLINQAVAQKKEVQPQPKTVAPTAEECETATRNYNLEMMGLCTAAEQARIEKCRQGVCQTEEIDAPVNNSVIKANRFIVK